MAQCATTDLLTETETENNSKAMHTSAQLQAGLAADGAASSTSPVTNQCRFCYGEEKPLIQPCNCKGSMAFVHGNCLGKWLETRPSLRCDICHYSIQQTLELKCLRHILHDLIKLLVKRLTREKFLIFKVVIYSAYIVLSCKKAIACYRLLVQQLKKNFYAPPSQGSNNVS